MVTVCVRIPEDWNHTLKKHMKEINESDGPKMSKEAFLNRVIAREVAKIRREKG
jgi:hypothetical protein